MGFPGYAAPMSPVSRPLFPWLASFRTARGALCLCRGCLRQLERDPEAVLTPGPEAGLCPRCWAGLLPLAEQRCPRCALVHGEGSCPEPTAWSLGDALWDYHGGRPPLGALLVPGIKQGETGWREALLRHLMRAPLPAWAAAVDLVTAAPSTWTRRLLRGFDIGAEVAQVLAKRLERPYVPLLAKAWASGRQAARTESQRRRLPHRAIRLRPRAGPRGSSSWWTTSGPHDAPALRLGPRSRGCGRGAGADAVQGPMRLETGCWVRGQQRSGVTLEQPEADSFMGKLLKDSREPETGRGMNSASGWSRPQTPCLSATRPAAALA